MADLLVDAAQFELWRQDDNGNRFLIGTYSQRSIAEEQMDDMTRIAHKQTYWISGKSLIGGTDGKK
jgi:hypothetical protein